MIKRPDLIVFDLDGTLADTVPDIAPAVNAALSELGRDGWPQDRIREWVGSGARRLMARALTGDPDGQPPAPQLDAALEHFLEAYGRRVLVDSDLFPGVEPALARLHARGTSMACVSNKPEHLSRAVVEGLGIDRYFHVVVGGDSLPAKKPDPLPLVHAANVCRVNPSETLMVGDSDTDVTAARAAGMPVVCVDYGYNAGRDIRASFPDALIGSLEELPLLWEKAA